MSMIVAGWILSGLIAWLCFGHVGRTKRFNPFHDASFYFAILPLFVVMPPAGALVTAIVWLRNDEIPLQKDRP